jgi:hypothetical protein
MKYAILYVNGGPFIVAPADWSKAVDEWVGYMADPDYLRVNGLPLFAVIDTHQMRSTFGSSAAVGAALEALRAAARSRGLPGVYVVGGFFTTDGSPAEDGLFPDLSAVTADGYDAVTLYGYGFSVRLGLSGMLPFADLAEVGSWTWTQAAARSPLAFIPVAMNGWDPRPWGGENETGRPDFWFSRSPGEVADLVGKAIDWAESTPGLRVEPAPAPPIALIATWNELGEGDFMVPTAGEGTAIGDALAQALTAPSTRARTVLTVEDGGGAAQSAKGTLTDAAGMPIAGATISVTAAPTRGVYAEYELTGHAPAGAVSAVVGFRVNEDDPVMLWPGNWLAGPRSSAFTLYHVSYVEPADPTERLANGDFGAGSQSWTLAGKAQLAPSDRGAGQAVQVLAAVRESAGLDSAPFPITAGAEYRLTIAARIAPAALGSGYFWLAWRDANDFLQVPSPSPGTPHSESLPIAPGHLPMGTATTNAAGQYQVSLSALGNEAASVAATFAGDSGHWPAAARVGP